jgi:hypothetical protein
LLPARGSNRHAHRSRGLPAKANGNANRQADGWKLTAESYPARPRTKKAGRMGIRPAAIVALRS